MQIGELARTTGLSVDAIRFYERCGLVEKPSRTLGGFRLYRPADLDDLRFVQGAQRLGFSLKEISELLNLRRSGGHACAHVRNRLAAKLGVVQLKIRELKNFEKELRASLARCEGQLRQKSRPAGPCPVLAGSCGRKKVTR